MNKLILQEAARRELVISAGFVLEICLFILAGYSLTIHIGAFFILITLALITAVMVGNRIERLAIFKHKWGLD